LFWVKLRYNNNKVVYFDSLIKFNYMIVLIKYIDQYITQFNYHLGKYNTFV